MYLSPEQVRGLRIGPPHEVFGLARLLYELLTGKPLFAARSVFDYQQEIRNCALPLLPRAAARLEPVLCRALDKDPAVRHATPGAFADELEAVGVAASADEVAAWASSLGGDALVRQAMLHSRLARVDVPAQGYFVVDRWAVTQDGTIYFAVRADDGGREAVALRRMSRYLFEDAEWIEDFLSEAAFPGDGLVRTDDAGTDEAGGVFRAQPFVRGRNLTEVLAQLQRRRMAAPPEIAVAVLRDAARALERVLSVPAPGGEVVGIVGASLTPSSLRIDLGGDLGRGPAGRAVWTSLGVAPSPHYTAPRRLEVPIAIATGLVLEP
jgi:hypothetical protein